MTTLKEQMACVAREIALRERVYPKLIASGKLRPNEAEYQLATMHDVLDTLRDCKDETLLI